MRATSLTKLYAVLTPDERFRLAVRAAARDDGGDELARLRRSCPRREYTMADAAFVDRWDGAERAVTLWVIGWREKVRLVEVCEHARSAYIETMAAFTRGYVLGANAAAAGDVPFDVDGREPTGDELGGIGLVAAAESVPDSLQSAYREHVGELKGLYAGLVQFSALIGVAPTDALAAWWAPVLGDLERLGDVMGSEIPADEVLAGEVAAKLASHWPDAAGAA